VVPDLPAASESIGDEETRLKNIIRGFLADAADNALLVVVFMRPCRPRIRQAWAVVYFEANAPERHITTAATRGMVGIVSIKTPVGYGDKDPGTTGGRAYCVLRHGRPGSGCSASVRKWPILLSPSKPDEPEPAG